MNWSALLKPAGGEDGCSAGEPRKRGILFLWAAVFCAVFLLAAGGYAWAKKSVVLVVDGKRTEVRTFSRTVGGVLKKLNIVLLDKDTVDPPPETPLREGMVVTVERAREVCVAVDGGEVQVRTRGQTVGDVLAECGIVLGPEDEVTPGREAAFVQGTKIVVSRVNTALEVEEVPLAYEVKRRYTVALPQGATRIAQEGREGTERRTWQVTYRDGREVSRQLASAEVIAPPVDKVVMVGSGMVVSRGGENIRYSECIEMLASGYTFTGHNTAMGIYPSYGVAAVDPGRIPMGTRLYVEGYGYATALDRGSAIKGDRIDLFFESREEAMNWGLKRVKVYVLD